MPSLEHFVDLQIDLQFGPSLINECSSSN